MDFPVLAGEKRKYRIFSILTAESVISPGHIDLSDRVYDRRKFRMIELAEIV